MLTDSLEIMKTNIWHIDPRFVESVRPQIEAILNGDAKVGSNEFKRKPQGFFCRKSNGFRNDLILSEDPEWDMRTLSWRDANIQPDDQFINVLAVTSAVTRNGGWCSSGSKEHRDQMFFAAKYQNCIGHLFVIDTPGGSAFSKNDYEQGIQRAREAGQPVIAFIDGRCCSAGMALASLCDEIYFMHPNDEVGCIGSMACFYTRPDGSKSRYDNTTYHELYDPESYDKNLWYRELANNDNDALIIAELAEDGAAFRELVKTNRPKVADDHLHGKVFKAKDVEGILVDGQKNFDECVQRIIDLGNGATPLKVLAAQEEPEVPQIEIPATPTTDEPNTNSKSQLITMETPFINAAIGNELVIANGGSFFVPAMIEAVEAKGAEGMQAIAALQSASEQITVLNGKIEEMKQQLAQLTEQKAQAEALSQSLTEERDTLANEKAQLEIALGEAKQNAEAEGETTNTRIAELQTEIDNLKQQAQDAETAHTAAIEAKDAEIAALQSHSAAAPTPSPEEEAQQAKDAIRQAGAHNVTRPGMSPTELAAALLGRMNHLQGR